MRGAESGFSLVAAVASMTLMLLFMGMAAPTWRYVMQDMREEELIFRGGQIADAIGRYQRKNGNAYPPSMDVLVQQKHLRKAYKDPMAADGAWRIIRQGEPLVPTRTMPGLTGVAGPSPSPTPSARPGGLTGGAAGQGGGTGIVGVASRSTEKSLRAFNGHFQYDEWLFVAGQPRVVGKQRTAVPLPGGVRSSPSPTR